MSLYTDTLAAARVTPASRWTGAQTMAIYCADLLLSKTDEDLYPEYVWNGAMAQRLTAAALIELTDTDIHAVLALAAPTPGPVEITVLKEDYFRGRGLRNPWGFLYTAIGPDGSRFDNTRITGLREALRRRYGRITVSIQDRTAAAHGKNPAHVN